MAGDLKLTFGQSPRGHMNSFTKGSKTITPRASAQRGERERTVCPVKRVLGSNPRGLAD